MALYHLSQDLELLEKALDQAEDVAALGEAPTHAEVRFTCPYHKLVALRRGIREMVQTLDHMRELVDA